MSDRPSWLRRTLYAAGVAAMAYGIVGLLLAPRGPSLVAWLRFWVGGVVVHDVVIAALTAFVSAAVVRLVPPPARTYMLAGAVISGVLLVVALPLVLGFGRSPDVPSALPLNYGRGLLVTLAAVWTGILVGALVTSSKFPHRGRRP
jgi:hypothetical protein